VSPRQRGWWLEDATPGGTIQHPGGRTIAGDEHPRLAWLTDNASDIHGDVNRAAGGPFGQTLVLGALTAAVVVGLAEPATGPPVDAPRAVSDGWSSIVLAGLVMAGDTLVASSKVEDLTIDVDGRGGRVRRLIEGRNQRGEVVIRIRDERWAPSLER
jgi:acyl dehydratase